MGKRELLLVVVFMIAGAVVYHVSAPPPAPGEQSFSLGQLVENFRRHVRGNRASAESTTTTRHPVDAGVAELRVNSRMGELTILGEDRPDIEAELRVQSNGYDDAEAQQLAHETTLLIEGTGSRLVAGVVYPRAGTQRTLRLVLKVPARLQITLDAGGGPVAVTGVAGVELSSTRGEARIRSIAGKVTGTHRGGELHIAECASVRLTTMNADVQVERVSGETSVNIRSGELRATDLGGPIDVDSQGADITLDKLQKASGVLRVNAVSGSITIKGLQTEARIDVHNSDLDLVAERTAPLAVYSDGGGSVEITPAPGGYRLDALATSGDIRLPEGTLQTTTSGEEHRAAGAVRGGGPALTIRTARADITVRER
jgi:hypothetical protein